MGLREEHRHRVFVSIDVVGSTQHKASLGSHEWITQFESFFDDAPVDINKAIKAVCGTDTRFDVVELRVWKFAGDEVLLTGELACPRDAFTVVWGVREFLLSPRDGKQLQLPLKGAVWSAEFVDRNRYVSPGGADVEDYIGPCIDRGFRLCGHSNVKRLVLSPEIAAMCVDTAKSYAIRSDLLPLRYEGDKVLKGVASEMPIPIFGTPIEREPTKKDVLLGKPFHHESDQLADMLREFFDSGIVDHPSFADHTDARYSLSDERIEAYAASSNTRAGDVADLGQDEAETDKPLAELQKPRTYELRFDQTVKVSEDEQMSRSDE